jgi:hypothetical protein
MPLPQLKGILDTVQIPLEISDGSVKELMER